MRMNSLTVDVLPGNSHIRKSTGTLTDRTSTFQKNTDEIRNRVQQNGALQIVVDEEPEFLRTLGDHEVEVIEENTIGQVVQGEDGEFYVVVDDSSPDVSGLQEPGTAELVVTEDGSQTYFLPNAGVNDPVREDVITNEQGTFVHRAEGTAESNGVISNRRALKTVLIDSGNGTYEMAQMYDDNEGVAIDSRGEPINVGAITTAETGESLGVGSDPFPQGMKMRRNRVYGECRCSECGQSFVNTARLERHLAVHQIFGSFLCPLCGKTYKYEYNLFYHWRRTCRDLNELVSLEDRKTMDVNALRQLVDDVALKKSEIDQIEIGINRNFLFGTSPYARLEMPSGYVGCRGTTCGVCGIVVPSAHLHKHLSLHRGESVVDNRNVSGGFFCDLCGIMFRQHFNLIKHWRTSCPEIQANLPEDEDITMDDDGLRRMVTRLMRRSPEDIEEGHMKIDPDPRPPDEIIEKSQLSESGGTQVAAGVGETKVDEVVVAALNGVATEPCQEGPQSVAERAESSVIPEERQRLESFDGKWGDEQDIVFADDFVVDDDGVVSSGDSLTAAQNRTKWSLSGGPVQCSECFRSFANSGRLERHLAGFHASFGSHHCILCGNRFKYDYNLLYHYRRSCPYTRAFIDHDVREQIDAMNLRKLVRNLSQKEVNLMPHISKSRIPYKDPADIIGSRRQLLRYPTPANQPPPHLLVPRPGLGRGKSCPVCSVIFYGNIAIERHLKAAHPIEFEEWNLQGLLESSYLEESGRRIVMQEIIDEAGDVVEEAVEEVPEPPPTLTAELPVEQPVVSTSRSSSINAERSIRQAHIEEDEHGNQRIVDENGVVIEATDGEVPLQIEDNENLRQYITVQLQVPDGEIIFVEENVSSFARYKLELGRGECEKQLGSGVLTVICEAYEDPNGFGTEMDNGQIIGPSSSTYVAAGEYVEGSNNLNKYYVKNPSFAEVQTSDSQESGNAYDVGLEVATILTRMKKRDDEKDFGGEEIPGEQSDSVGDNSRLVRALESREVLNKGYGGTILLEGQRENSGTSHCSSKSVFKVASDSSVIDSNSSRGIVSEGTTLTAVADGEDLAPLVKRSRIAGPS
ncbi:unnamed protein product [Enterobius vermicularis]|uniref:C2H2-type domain-containing protein n=1 Tax=Enterobius vermicularis TaxID=51028 RepID=A0A0N4UVF0_ENTVE|nr:unnamed protein product [Enterobius vermicularis]